MQVRRQRIVEDISPLLKVNEATKRVRQNCVRSGIRTHAHIRGPENSLMRHEKDVNLESGALDHSAILTCVTWAKDIKTFCFGKQLLPAC